MKPTDLEAWQTLLQGKSAIYTITARSRIINGVPVPYTEVAQMTDDELNVSYQFDENGDAMNNFTPVVS